IQNNIDNFIGACTLDGNLTVQNALIIADRLIEQNRFEDAYKFLDPLASKESQVSYFAQELKAKIIKAQGDCAQTHAILQEIFKSNPNYRLYQQLLESPLTNIDTFKQEAVECALAYQEPHIALMFFIDMYQALEQKDATDISNLIKYMCTIVT